ncbi:MAG: hypothetical protein WDA60_09535 [Acidimicrobiia bacterium]|jgi:hypothetical protein
MSRRVILFLVLAILVVVGGAVAVFATARPALEDDRQAVDARWAALRGPLAVRYEGLGQLATALANGGAGDRSYTVALTDEVGVWADLARSSDPDPDAEATAANRLEGLAARVRANVAESARLGRDTGVTQALGMFDSALVPTADVEAYNRAVRRYQATRTDTLKRIPADLLGYDARPVLVIGVAAAR